jgi:BRCA1-associated ATM activator 1
MLANESEGIVRREAVNTLKSVYANKDIPKEYFDSVFSSVAHCATNDLYWEVKVNSLCFWKSVVCHQLHHQGTFSKELKKIVTLNEREILMRLNKMMEELSARGCFGVLLACLNDECDLEVVKTAVKITQMLLDCLTKYHYLDKRHTLDKGVGRSVVESNPKKQMEKPSAVENGSKETNESYGNPMDADAVIESIVNSTDINLLAMKYQNDMSLNGNHAHSNDDDVGDKDPAADVKIDEFYYKEFAKVSVDEFLNTVTKVDLNEIVEKRSEWLSHTESFESLLDDILTSFKDDSEVNDADCY